MIHIFQKTVSRRLSVNEVLFHKLGDVLDELDKIMPDAGDYKSDMKEAYNELNDIYVRVKEVYGYKDNSDEE